MRLWVSFKKRDVFEEDASIDVRNQKGSFAIKVKPSSKWTDRNVSRWKAALREVANLSGEVVLGHETSILEKIVNTIYKKLGSRDLHLPSNITGMATRYEGIKSWFDQSNCEFLAVYGMGGCGKTTLAKYIYNSNQKSFNYVSFVEHIGSRCEKPNGLLEVQKQLFKDILGGGKRKIPGVFQGTPMIAEALQKKRTLIVLDDIVGHSQLVDLLGNGDINTQSKIIVTTRENTDNWLDFPHSRCKKYAMRLLNDNESLQLLCRHAFRFENPKEGFQEVVLRAVHYCGGNPLALEVLGSSLFKSDSIQYWESQLRLLERDMDSRVHGVLIRSYTSLPSETVKKLFLHIACFFNGRDEDYVVKILEPDYSAISGIKILIDRCLLSVSPNKELIMHSLVEEMGKYMVRQESHLPANRSRVWDSDDSYKLLRKGMVGFRTVEGLALDMNMLSEENFAIRSPKLKTNALKNMDSLKLLQLNFVELDGSYENFSEGLRWLCWLGFHLKTIPSDLYMGHLVAIDMSYSKLEVFEPPMVLQSLHILNLKDSHDLTEIRNIFNIPHLETLILWNCYSLVNVCSTLGDLTSLALLNMTGCNALGVGDLTKPIFSFPSSLRQLFLKYRYLKCTDSIPLSFSAQLNLQYLNLGDSLFDSLPCYDHLENLRVLDLSFCYRLKCLKCLPNTLAELNVYCCESLERITFQSPRFTLQEFVYLGCTNLYKVEGFMKLVPIAKLNETKLGHLKWLNEYQKHKVCLVGADELTVGRSWHIKMLYEFGIMSTSLPDIKDPNMTPEYISESSSLSFDVPSGPKNKRLKGINVTFKYSISGDDWAFFCKVSTSNGVLDLMYNPQVYGKPKFGELCIWLSYWPIGYTLKYGDRDNVSIVVLSGLEVHECGVSLVYSDKETLENNMGWAEILGGDLSEFQLSTGGYYLCRRDFFRLIGAKRPTPDWFRILVGDTINYTEVTGWRNTGRPKHVYPSFAELKTIGCIIHGPQLKKRVGESMSNAFDSGESKSVVNYEPKGGKKIVLAVKLDHIHLKRKFLKVASTVTGVESLSFDMSKGELTICGGHVDPIVVLSRLRKIGYVEIISVGSYPRRLAKQDDEACSVM
ncbi:hypothetical protein SSX86_006683 [Deinandra increscens subsp. villosa]|uniref:Uncharacterized protein n=1 Tax=Deinandra increscens subsp. villosa TaxID=3103831 RepID=A0AAP0H6R5_9ASTR